MPPRRRGVQLALACGAAALALGGAWAWLRPGGPAGAASLAGDWLLRAAAPANESGSRLDAVTLHVTHSGEDVKLYSEPIDIRRDPAWTGFAQQWQERFGNKLEQVVWRGVGRVLREPGARPAFEVSLRVETAAGGDPIETGNLAAELAADGQRMTGRLWMNGEQAERSFEMARGAPD